MLPAYFCYFWDFHRSWSWDHPLVFWSSSYQAGMPMHAYWQSGYLYPVTWILFGPLSPHLGIHLFYAFHFALGIFGFLRLGPHLGLRRPASLWAGIAFALSGTVLARYEHATFLAGWTWLPLVLAAFLVLRDAPGIRNLMLYAAAVALQALGGHPQASAATAILIGIFTAAALVRAVRGLRPRSIVPSELPTAGRAAAGWILGGHVLALLYCAPLLVPFLHLVEETSRYAGSAHARELYASREAGSGSQPTTAAEKLEDGVFGFEEFSTGGFRPLHFLSLAAAHALGSPSNASWWGGEVWGEVFVYAGVLGLFFCFFASWKRARGDMRLLWIVGLLGLWIAFGAHLGASQILYHVPVMNNFRRPARFLILFVMALAALSAHGFQRWTARPRGRRLPAVLALAGILLSAAFLALRASPGLAASLLDFVQGWRSLDPAKDYSGKVAALAGRLSFDFLFIAVSGAALWYAARILPGPRARSQRRMRGAALVLLLAVLVADLVRLHWDHFHLFPRSYYREPPATVTLLDDSSRPFWRVSHYLEYPGLEMWRMHNNPLASMDLIDREKAALGYGIHAVFGYDHVGAHLPLLWNWPRGLTPAEKSARYLLTNRKLSTYHGDSLRFLGERGPIRVYELPAWRPRFELRLAAGAPGASLGPGDSAVGGAPGSNPGHGPHPEHPGPTSCDPGFAGHGGLCVREVRDGGMEIRGSFRTGDTLTIRERAYPGWLVRVDDSSWQVAQSTPEHFLTVPFSSSAAQVELAYVPRDFHILTGLASLVTAALLLLKWAKLRRKTPK
jgi:hypothetical protein